MTRSAGGGIPLLFVSIALAVASCGGDSSDTTSGSTSTASATTSGSSGEGSTTTTGTTGTAPQSIDVGATASYQGFIWNVDSATFGPSGVGVPTVLVKVSIANPDERNGQPNSQIALESGGKGYIALTTGMSRIDAGGELDTEFEFQVDPASFDLNTATLVLGTPENNQARIGFGSMAPESVLRTPVSASVAADNAPSPLLVAVSDVVVRWDDPIAYTQSATGSAYLSVTFSLTSEANSTFAKRNMALTLPDGSQVEPESAPNDRLDAGVEYEAITAIFLVADPPSGDYTFSMTGMIGYAGETFDITFSVP